MDNAGQRYGLYAVVVALSLSVWGACVFGVGVHDYADGQYYATNAVSVARSFQPASVTDWDMFVSGAELGASRDMSNPGYVFLLAVPALFAGSYHIWFGSVVNLFFFVCGAFFLVRTFEELVPEWVLWLGTGLVLTNQLIWDSYSRPLTDASLWFFLFFTLYRVLKKGAGPWQAGLLLGVASVFRIQALFFAPWMWILLCRPLNWRSFLRTNIQVGVAAMGVFLVVGAVKALLFGGATGSGVAGYAQVWGASSVQLGVMDFIKNVHVSFLSLPSMTRYTPLIAVFPASLFCLAAEDTHCRLRWFATLNVVLVILFVCLVKPPSGRYMAIYLPLVVFLSLQYGARLAEGMHRYSKVAALCLAGFALVASMNGPVQLLKAGMNMSFDNLELTEPEEIERILGSYSEDTVVASATVEANLYFEGRNVVLLPQDAEAFLVNAGRNHEIDVLTISYNMFRETQGTPQAIAAMGLGPVYMPEAYGSWEGLLAEDRIVDTYGNVFEKVYEQHGRFVTRYVYEARGTRS